MALTVHVPLAEGFEELEAVTIIDVLRRGGVCVRTAGLGGRRVTGSHGLTLEADADAEELLARKPTREADAFVLPGGMPGAATLRDHRELTRLLKSAADSGCLVAAICAAPIALGRAGILQGRRATCYPGFEGELTGATICEDRVCIDRSGPGAVITSRGPGTALEFALTLLSELGRGEQAEKLRQGMLVAG